VLKVLQASGVKSKGAEKQLTQDGRFAWWVAAVAYHAGTSEGARLNGVGIGEILPRSYVLGLEDEATVPGVHAVYVARSLRRKPVPHIAEWAGDFSDVGEGISNSVLAVPYSLCKHIKKRVNFTFYCPVVIFSPCIFKEDLASMPLSVTHLYCKQF
jgi:hypothetical protein